MPSFLYEAAADFTRNSCANKQVFDMILSRFARTIFQRSPISTGTCRATVLRRGLAMGIDYESHPDFAPQPKKGVEDRLKDTMEAIDKVWLFS